MPSTRSRRLEIGLAVLSVLVVLYSLVVVQQVLLGALLVGTVWFVYLLFLFVTVLARIARSLETIAAQRTGPAAERDTPLSNSGADTDAENSE